MKSNYFFLDIQDVSQMKDAVTRLDRVLLAKVRLSTVHGCCCMFIADRGTNGDVGIEGNSGSDGKGKGVRWYRHVLRRDDGHVLGKALEFEVKGKMKRGRPKKTWKTQVEKESKSVGLEEDAVNRVR